MVPSPRLASVSFIPFVVMLFLALLLRISQRVQLKVIKKTLLVLLHSVTHSIKDFMIILTKFVSICALSGTISIAHVSWASTNLLQTSHSDIGTNKVPL
jgi:hypothetical protein